MLFLLPGAASAGAQDYKTVTNSSKYISAIGEGKTFKEADNNALALIAEQINVKVSSSFSSEVDKDKNTVIDKRKQKTQEVRKSRMKSIVETYSDATLPMCRQIVVENGPKKYKIVRYIEASELDKVFTLRMKKVRNMLAVAEKAEAELKMDVALKYYCWAEILNSTLVHPDATIYESEGSGRQMASVWITSRMDDILGNIDFSFTGFLEDDPTIGKVQVTYKKIPVTSLDFSFWDGLSWSSTTQVKDGTGTLEFRANAIPKLYSVKIEYAYEAEAHTDREISQIMDFLAPEDYPAAYKESLPIVKKVSKAAKAAARRIESENQVTASVSRYANMQIGQTPDSTVLRGKLNAILDAISAGNYASVRDMFTDEGYGIFDRLIHNGSAKVVDRSKIRFRTFENQVFCRSVPMRFSFRTNNKSFVENVVFIFDEHRLVSNICFGLEAVSVNDILSREQWPESTRLVIINFLENYKTAFALKRLDYLDNIFSEDALIITGRVVKKTVIENQIPITREYVEYNRQSKGEYITNLRRSFASKEYINLSFSNTEFRAMDRGDSEIYGLQIKQDYVSSNYGDTGYLFLVVDVTDYHNPIIHVRTWQPQPDPEFGLFGPEQLQL